MTDDAALAALTERVARLEEFAARLAGLLGAAGQVLDMAKLVEREQLRGEWKAPPAARSRRRTGGAS